MFGRRRKTVWMARLEGDQGLPLYEGPLERLHFDESCVLALSVEFFDDPSPCEIHRSAVILRAIEEIRAACTSADPLPVSGLNERIRGLLGAYPQASTVRVWEQQG